MIFLGTANVPHPRCTKLSDGVLFAVRAVKDAVAWRVEATKKTTELEDPGGKTKGKRMEGPFLMDGLAEILRKTKIIVGGFLCENDEKRSRLVLGKPWDLSLGLLDLQFHQFHHPQ